MRRLALWHRRCRPRNLSVLMRTSSSRIHWANYAALAFATGSHADRSGCCIGWADLNSSLPSVCPLPLAVITAYGRQRRTAVDDSQSRGPPVALGRLHGQSADRALELDRVLFVDRALFAISRLSVMDFPDTGNCPRCRTGICGQMSRYEKPGGVTERIAMSVLALTYVGVLLSFVDPGSASFPGNSEFRPWPR